MKHKLIKILRWLYEKFRDTGGEFGMFCMPEHRTKSKSIELYRVRKCLVQLKLTKKYK
jgi:hypothetical protein